MMNIKDIDSAITTHRNWVAQFRQALKGTHEVVFDLQKAQDDSACLLGQWLSSDEAKNALGGDYLRRINTIHSTFHEIAGEIVESLNSKDPELTTECLIDGLADISQGVIEFLEHAKKLAKAP